ncbi:MULTISPECIES: GNAT family N-acetyltransferase [unclassified Microbacterium]|uniref:GNAT family N-acetyltransferase n=1 Tax=unclassified Microbacterium TaxID=2609290 RepID=UPI0011C43C97|nr:MULTISPECIES: GNAT family N-acetyltransferase [unclassified Microbacterium]MBT2484045.1 hypothetical protein [Microbacterium sp. ISL-108]
MHRQVAPALAADILTWTEGWARSRSHASPTPIHGGVHIHVGSAAESARYVLTAPNTERARELASGVTEPRFWIKWPAAVNEAEPRIPGGWTLIEPQFLMGTQLTAATPLLPDGYRLTLDDEGDALEARVTTDTGILAARGRLGLSTVAVPDQIRTQLEHQRRGLGKAIMSTLSNAALDRGRSDAVLLASDQGRRLYSTLGWRVITPFWAAVHAGR